MMEFPHVVATLTEMRLNVDNVAWLDVILFHWVIGQQTTSVS